MLLYYTRGQMETVFEKAKKFANKLQDEKNRKEYYPSCMNLALFADDDPNKPQVPAKENTPQPIPGIEAPVPDFSAPSRPTVRNINPIYPNAKEEEMPAPLPETPPQVRQSSLNGYVKPVFHSRFSGPGLRKSLAQKTNLNALSTDAMQQVRDPFEQPPTVTSMAPEYTSKPQEMCYYVLITHTKTYPEPGSQVLMRSCDHEYVWTNKQPEEEKPNHKMCTHCGRKVEYTETEIE